MSGQSSARASNALTLPRLPSPIHFTSTGCSPITKVWDLVTLPTERMLDARGARQDIEDRLDGAMVHPTT